MRSRGGGGQIPYLVAVGVAFIGAPAAVIITALVAVYYVFERPPRTERRHRVRKTRSRRLPLSQWPYGSSNGTPAGRSGLDPVAMMVECTGVVELIWQVMETVSPGGIICLTGVGSPTAPGTVSAAGLATDVVLKNIAVFGSVNANRRHYYRAARVLAAADRAWLEKLVTRRVRPDEAQQGLQRSPDDIKVVMEWQRGTPCELAVAGCRLAFAAPPSAAILCRNEPDQAEERLVPAVPRLIGTSGWQYRDWRGVLYPPGVPQRRWLEFYAGQFDTVENNNAFYRLPARETFAAWAERTPARFVMAVKASRYLTHIRRLKDPAGPVGRLLGAAAGLGTTLGPVLLQLPPTWQGDAGLLDEALAEFRRLGPAGLRIAVEMRHESCWTDEMRRVLTGREAALVWADRGGSPAGPLWRTAGWGYLRLHEGTAQPWPRYRRAELRAWEQRLSAEWAGEQDAYIYFNNDPGGAAIHDAVAFGQIAREAGHHVTRTPGTVPPPAEG